MDMGFRVADAVRVRTASLLACALVATILAAPAGSAAERRAASFEALEAGVLGELNALRRSKGLVPLRSSRGLRAAADRHSTAMARRGFFQHESADGTPFWTRVKRHYPQGRFGYWSVGENLLWSSPSLSAREAIQLWLESPPHRANLLNRRWREVGLSAVHVQAAPGVYGGAEVTILTADFGVRR
jgi:uncharacterized protein YkwD